MLNAVSSVLCALSAVFACICVVDVHAFESIEYTKDNSICLFIAYFYINHGGQPEVSRRIPDIPISILVGAQSTQRVAANSQTGPVGEFYVGFEWYCPTAPCCCASFENADTVFPSLTRNFPLVRMMPQCSTDLKCCMHSTQQFSCASLDI